MTMNLTGTEQVSFLGGIAPASLAAVATVGPWVPAKGFNAIFVVVQCGVLGAAATVDVKLRQATALAGTAAKDITGKATTQLVKATDDGKVVILNVRQEELDVTGGFDYVGVTVTVAAAASMIAVSMYGVSPKRGPASLANATEVAQVVT